MSSPESGESDVASDAAKQSRWRMDLSPLRASSQYRKLFFGGAISFLGSMVTYVAIPFQVKELTDSSLLSASWGSSNLCP